MNFPDEYRYTEEHEWIAIGDDGTIRIGITDYAQDQLGDVVFVELPAPDTEVEAGGMLAEVESTKSVAEVYAPVAGVVESVNEALVETPELVNQAPYTDGWFAVLRPAEPVGEDSFLSAADYRAFVE